ncbi:unnamed protein product [Ceratitis capitata]|uniref:(Mediterranean fruit fly) hypothetical protein n=1 Tax=Ceratitis capitata TaxID=7213 RepID=A0A811U4D2_CERCA|nr:unnamed protein product [Ceratitis capitata]
MKCYKDAFKTLGEIWREKRMRSENKLSKLFQKTTDENIIYLFFTIVKVLVNPKFCSSGVESSPAHDLAYIDELS